MRNLSKTFPFLIILSFMAPTPNFPRDQGCDEITIHSKKESTVEGLIGSICYFPGKVTIELREQDADDNRKILDSITLENPKGEIVAFSESPIASCASDSEIKRTLKKPSAKPVYTNLIFILLDQPYPSRIKGYSSSGKTGVIIEPVSKKLRPFKQKLFYCSDQAGPY